MSKKKTSPEASAGSAPPFQRFMHWSYQYGRTSEQIADLLMALNLARTTMESKPAYRSVGEALQDENPKLKELVKDLSTNATRAALSFEEVLGTMFERVPTVLHTNGQSTPTRKRKASDRTNPMADPGDGSI